MLISFPVDYNKYSNRFPWAIALLAILLCTIYFTCQINDQYDQKKALQYYFQSKLYQLELPAYIDYLTKNPNENILKPDMSIVDLYWVSRGDNEFQHLLTDNKIIPTTHLFYWEWYARHQNYQYLLTLDSTDFFGFKAALPTISDAFTCIFLHGNFIHLFGNIIFLFFIGRYVEVCIGGLATLMSFVALGMGSVGMYYILTPPTLYPLVGASGAIAGLMGFFCILYQTEKLLFFVNVFFFSGLFRFNPIILLPIWIGWEFFQSISLQTEEVAYTAHIGGVLLGALVGIISKRIFPSINPRRSNPKQQEFQELYAQAMLDLTNLDFPKAKKSLLKLHEDYPEERVVLYKLFFILKLEPKSDKYREIVQEIVKLNLYDPDELAIQTEVKNHYQIFTLEAVVSDQKN